MNYVPPDVAAMLALQNADVALNTARALGRPLPADMPELEKWRDEAERLSQADFASTADIDTPADVGKLEAVLRKHVRAEMEHDALKAAATVSLDSCRRSIAAAIRASIPEWVDAARIEFAAAVAEINRNAAALNRSELFGTEDPETVAGFLEGRRALGRLDQLVKERMAYGVVLGERLHSKNKLWIAAVPPNPDDTTVDRNALVTRLLNEYDTNAFNARPAHVRWHEIAITCDLELAAIGQLPGREETWARCEAKVNGNPVYMTEQGSSQQHQERTQRAREQWAAKHDKHQAEDQAARARRTEDVRRARELGVLT